MEILILSNATDRDNERKENDAPSGAGHSRIRRLRRLPARRYPGRFSARPERHL